MHSASQQLHGLQYVDREWQKQGGHISKRNDSIREGLTKYVHSKVGTRPDLVKKVLPDYAPLVRRLIGESPAALCALPLTFVQSTTAGTMR